MVANSNLITKSPSGPVLLTLPIEPGNIEPGADNQLLFTRSGVVDWSNLRGTDLAGLPWNAIFTSASDLAPFAVGSNFELPTGSYAFASTLALGTSGLIVPAGATVLLKGFGTDKLITSAHATATLQVSGNARIETLAVEGTNSEAIRVNTSGNIRSDRCRWVNTGGTRIATLNGAATWRDILGVFSSSSSGVRLTSSGNLLSLAGVDLTFIGVEGGIFNSSTGSTVLLDRVNILGRTPINFNDSTGILTLQNCSIQGTGGQPAVRLQTGTRVLIQGGTLDASGVYPIQVQGPVTSLNVANTRLINGGILIGGNIADALLVSGCSAGNSAGANSFIEYSSGTVRAASVNGNRAGTTVGITWAAANIPANGLMIVGNLFDSGLGTGFAFNGFTEASARVNAKANIDTGTLMSETPIVP